MIQFGFTEEQLAFQRMVRRFAHEKLLPSAAERAKLDHMPKEILRALGEANLLGLTIPEKYGGQPADWVTLGIAVEELAKVDITAALAAVIVAPAQYQVLQLAAEDVLQEWLPRITAGEILTCNCMTEPDCGSDLFSLKTSATREGDSYVLNGEKTSITWGMQGEAGIVFARTDPSVKARGISCFFVPFDLPGIARAPLDDMGCLPMRRASIIFDEVRVPEKYLVGEENRIFTHMAGVIDRVRPVAGLVALGAAQASIDEAMAYAKERRAFGQPIGKFQGVSFQIAEDATLVEAARLLCYRALSLADQGLPHVKESAMAKWFAPEAGVRAIHNSLLVHGHFGYTSDLRLEQRLRDVIGLEIADGAAQIQKMSIVREMMGKEFA